MKGILLKGIFRCRWLASALNGWPRKRRKSFALRQVKRQKWTTAPIFSQQAIAEDVDETPIEDVQSEQIAGVPPELSEILAIPISVPDAPSALKQESSLYPSVVYEGNVAAVKLGVGQMVILDGCSMVQVVEGQASMLGYSFPCSTEVLVCSSSKLAEVITIEARPERSGGSSLVDGREESKSSGDVLGCQLRFASHTLGQTLSTSDGVSGRALSFKLDFVGIIGKEREKVLGNQYEDETNELHSEDDELDLDSEASYSDSEDGDERDDEIEVPAEDGEPEIAKKRKGRELSASSAKKRRVVETLEEYSAVTHLPYDWTAAVETITLGSSVPVLAVCGAKNVGKSTFGRFLVNSLLNRYKEVAYLDTDVGQPEFTAPGCISLHILDSPVVGPPAMHLRSPERCFFYGDVSPKSNPLMYGEYVTDLFKYFRHKYSVNSTSTIPLVINTHGWVKGIGYDVVVNILNTTSPTHVVQVLANSEKKNLPRNKFWDEGSSAQTIYVESAVEKLPMHHRSARSAHHLRAARLLAYFQQCCGENSAPFPYRESKLFAQTAMSLVRDTPYEVPFTALKIKHLHSEVPSSESLRCVNASIVGLGVTSGQNEDDERRVALPLCLGLGIVKAVDVKRGMFYISTPVPREELQQVDILLQGRVELPVPLLMARGNLCPYLSKTTQIVEGVGAGAMISTKKPSAKKLP